jgi:hypothetical protein
MQGNIKHFASNHDTILWYSKSEDFTFNKQTEKREEGPVKQLKRVWDKEKGAIVNAKGPDGKVLYIETDQKTVDDVWRIPMLQPADKSENVGYATQKREEIAERIIRAASNEGDLIADFFCGSGTTGVVAERLNRRWIMADLGRFAIHTTRKRLIELQRNLHAEKSPYRSFDVFNLGRYERQWWQKEHLQGADEEHRRIILSFYKSEPLTQSPSPMLHGRKGKAFICVDNIDSLLTRDELKAAAEACQQCGGTELHCLAWEFEMDLKLEQVALERQFGIQIKLIQIPREVMERGRINPPPFLEVAELQAEPVLRDQGKQRVADVKLTYLLPSLAEISTKELDGLRERAIESGFDFIDFWAVDFDYKPDQPFNHDWQAYRTRKERKLPLVSERRYEYPNKGNHTICVKVIDVFGADTTVAFEVKI